MSTEAIVNLTRKEWTESATKAASDKVNAKESYEEQKEYSMDTDSFDDWARKNVPYFLDSYQDYLNKKDAFFNVLRQHDSAKQKDLMKKFGMLRFHWDQGDLGDGKEKGSKFIIVSYDDLERYDEIINAMYEAQRKAAQS
ncbi:uncharacterized protein N7498_004848 [Penicillium cinerascens]|uniref:Uncharacterized protein n=1 Tax=Penicillium cinerascens TaxID=70096 RepID=A0A9W9MMA4_9EURO|nr:uncharacterized protein N7498_004848 [Penicillium cinerascens]KAJ5203969.1 hypothetical protein N7498_004848 [Penicillium cinerascens]